MNRSLLPALMMLTTSLLFVGCDSSSTPSEPESLSPNISGNWSGQTTMFGGLTNVTVSVSQATSDPGLTAVLPLTGTLTLNSGTPLAMTGTKQGNAWTMSGNTGDTIASIHQTLTSATTSAGDFTLQVGPATNKGTVPLNFVKS
jgi:hypothetical protein